MHFATAFHMVWKLSHTGAVGMVEGFTGELSVARVGCYIAYIKLGNLQKLDR